MALLAASLLCGCAVGPDFVRPAVPAAASYLPDPLPVQTASANTVGGAAQAFVSGKDIQADWWTLFSSPPLNALIQEALAKNPDVQAATASLGQAKENLYAAEGSFLPAIDANVNPVREKVSGSSFGNPFAPPTLFTLYNASVNVSYALDVFGGTRRQVESLQAQANTNRFQLEATYLSLTANVVTAAVEVASLRDQIEETRHIIAIERQQVSALQEQLKLGVLTKASVLEQQAALAQAEVTLPSLQKRLAQRLHQLSVLTGHFPGEKLVDNITLASLHLPEILPVSLPSRLVEQRPDIRAAEEQLHSASADIGIATANMLPQVNLNGSYGLSTARYSDLFAPFSRVWSISANLAQPIFRGGQLFHQRRAAVEAYQRAAAQYRGTVLLAFENVGDTLTALEFDAEALRAQVEAARIAANSLNVAEVQFKAGTIDYLALLDAQRTYLQVRIGLVQAQASRYEDTAALFQALGGGWWNRAEDTAEISS